MPQTGMDWWVIAGVVIAGIAAIIAWRQLGKKDTLRTTNAIKNGSRNTQTGGAGETCNSIEGGDDNTQSGA